MAPGAPNGFSPIATAVDTSRPLCRSLLPNQQGQDVVHSQGFPHKDGVGGTDHEPLTGFVHAETWLGVELNRAPTL